VISEKRTIILALGCGLLLSACGGGKSGSVANSGSSADTGKVLNLYIWSDYLAPTTLPRVEKLTGIKVNATYYDTNETLDAKLLARGGGYDIVMPTASYFEKQIKAGVYLPLDKEKLPNLKNMDPQLMAKAAFHDPGNAHGVIYLWGTNGIGYNEKMVKRLLPDAPLDSWRMVFDPMVASKVAKCGISVLNSPAEMMRAVFSYLGKDPNSQKPENLAEGEAVLLKVRPYIRSINSSQYIDALAKGDLCVAVAYNGDDILVIPKDAPHPESAYAFINFVMTPEVISEITNFKGYANANAAAHPLASVKSDPGIYPTPELLQKLTVQLADSDDQTRAIAGVWQKFRAGQ